MKHIDTECGQNLDLVIECNTPANALPIR